MQCITIENEHGVKHHDKFFGPNIINFNSFTYNFFIWHVLWRKRLVSLSSLCQQDITVSLARYVFGVFFGKNCKIPCSLKTPVYHDQHLTFDLLTSHDQHRHLYRKTKFMSLFQLHVGIRLLVNTIIWPDQPEVRAHFTMSIEPFGDW